MEIGLSFNMSCPLCRTLREAEAPILASTEAAIAALAAESDELSTRAEKLKAAGNEQREATKEMIEQIVSFSQGSGIIHVIFIL